MNFKKIGALALATVGLVAFAPSSAQAYTCFDTVYSPTGTFNATPDSGQGTSAAAIGYTSNYSARANCTATSGVYDASSALRSAVSSLRTAATQTNNLLTSRIAAVNSGSVQSVSVSQNGVGFASGMSGAGDAETVGVWGQVSYTSAEDDVTSTAFDGDLVTGLVGVDYMVDDALLVGLSVGYEDSDYTTEYNRSPVNQQDGNIEGDGYTVAPYLSYKLDEILSVQLTGGYSDLDYDIIRYDVVGGDKLTGETDGERYFVSGALSAYYPVDMWRLNGTLSILYADEERDAYNEVDPRGFTNAVAATDTDLTQLNLRTEIGYAVEPWFVPYAIVGFQYDLSKSDVNVPTTATTAATSRIVAPEDEDFAGIFGLGFNVEAEDAVFIGLEATTMEFRDDYEEYTVSGTVRVEF